MGDHEGRPYGFMRSFAVGANLVFALCQHHAFFNTLPKSPFAGSPNDGILMHHCG